MKNLTARQYEVLSKLDAAEWRALERADAIVAGVLCKPFRAAGRRYVESQIDVARTNSASVYRLTFDGALRLKFEKARR
jgi:hypothetical protein